jgi:tRNA G18 (ribose-2'-O)-methylase SpoU
MNSIPWRLETRRERMIKKMESFQRLPVEICTVNFAVDENAAYIIRSAACFGAVNINIIGKLPDRKFIYSKSGSNLDYMNIKEFHSVSSFLQYSRENHFNLIAAELSDDSIDFDDYVFDFNKNNCIVLGNENTGVPAEICMNAQVVQIHMGGFAPCLNTAHTGSIILHEAQRQFRKSLFSK